MFNTPIMQNGMVMQPQMVQQQPMQVVQQPVVQMQQQMQVPTVQFPPVPAIANNPALQQQLFQVATGACQAFAGRVMQMANTSQLHMQLASTLSQNNFNNKEWLDWTLNVYCIVVGLALSNKLANTTNDVLAQMCNSAALVMTLEKNPALQSQCPIQVIQGIQSLTQVKVQLNGLIVSASNVIQGKQPQQMTMQPQVQQVMPQASSFTISQPAQVSAGGTYVGTFDVAPAPVVQSLPVPGGSATLPNWRDGMEMIDSSSARNKPVQQQVQQPVQQVQQIIQQPVQEVVAKPRMLIEPIGENNFVQEWSSQNPGVVSINELKPTGETHGYMPQNIKEVVVDPNDYKRPGFVYDTKRPYDLVHNFGGVEIRPDFLCDWVATYDEDQPWPYLYNRDTHLRFLVKWPDGTVKEKIVEIKAGMEYLKHELNAELRDKAMPYQGVVVPRDPDIIIETTKEVKVVSVEDAFKQRIDESFKAEASIVTLEEPIVATSIEEAAYIAREEVRKELELDSDERTPAHIYTRRVNHVLQLSDTGIETMRELSKLGTFKDVADSLIRITRNGDISQSALRFINQRMTKAVNNLMAEQMRMEITISDFLEDGPQLFDYLNNKYGSDKAAEFRSWERPTIIRNLCVADRVDSDGVVRNLDLVDFHRTLQLGGQSAELLGLDTKAVTVLSTYTHEALREAIRVHTFESAEQTDTVFNTRLFIVTSDGCRFEMIPSGRKGMPILLAPREA